MKLIYNTWGSLERRWRELRESHKAVAHVSSGKRKELSAQNLLCGGNILQNEGETKTFSNKRKLKKES